MGSLPLIRDTTPGIYQVCTSADTDYVITIPATATGCVFWFETSTSVATMIRGRVGFDQANTAVTSISATSTNLGFHPPMPVEYTLKDEAGSMGPHTNVRDLYLHVASSTAGAVVRGLWLYASDAA